MIPSRPTRSPKGALLAIVGTDTGVGKTVVAAGLIHGLREAGLRVAAFKPVETGLIKGRLPNGLADWQRLASASGQEPESCLGQSFALPAAPLAAAREANGEVDLSTLTAQLGSLRHGRDLVVVEGAGGLCVPFVRNLLWADVIAQWSLTCLVVGRLGLGTLNHTLLTLAELDRRDIPVDGVILNTLDSPGAETPQTPDLIQEFGGAVVRGVIPLGGESPADVARVLKSSGLMEQLTSRYKSD
jgi:dethiobiotin synthetase